MNASDAFSQFSSKCGSTSASIARSSSGNARQLFKRPTRKFEHTDRGMKIANQLAHHRNMRNLQVYERRGGSEEFERIMDLMDKRRQDLMQAREAKRFAAQQLLAEEDELEDDLAPCSLLPVQHANNYEVQRLRELEERQRQIEQMEAEIAEYSRLAEAESDRVPQVKEPWDISEDDYELNDGNDVEMSM